MTECPLLESCKVGNTQIIESICKTETYKMCTRFKDGDWSCHICGQIRPDAKISVLTKPFLLGVVQNIRYCNDNPLCVKGAKNYSLIKEELVSKTKDVRDLLEELLDNSKLIKDYKILDVWKDADDHYCMKVNIKFWR